jgi:hypothetical protein
MHFETAIVMIVGVVALVSLRVILAVVGRQYAADHPGARIPRESADEPVPLCRVVRGTGRKSHLLYFPDRLPHTAPAAEVPLLPAPRKAS